MRKPFYWKKRQAWYVKSDDGKTQTFLAFDEEEAFDRWAEMRAAHYPETVDSPVAAIAENFLRHAQRSVNQETFDRYARYVADFCNSVGSEQARQVKPYHVTRWLESRPTWGAWTQRSAIGAVKRMYAWAVEEQLLDRNPLLSIKRPAAMRRESLIDDEQHKAMMLGATHDGTDSKRTNVFRQVMIALRHSGARPGTVSSVRVEDVTPAVDAWVMKEHKTRKKTGKPLVIYLTPCLATLTRILMAARKEGNLFLNAQSQPWARNAIRCRMRRLRTKLGLRRRVRSAT